jgi:hypothetical protein
VHPHAGFKGATRSLPACAPAVLDALQRSGDDPVLVLHSFQVLKAAAAEARSGGSSRGGAGEEEEAEGALLLVALPSPPLYATLLPNDLAREVTAA